jgi:hypothetical protein
MYYRDELAAIDTPISETYVPYPDGTMTCEDISQMKSACVAAIEHWNQLYANAGYRESKANIAAILHNLSGKMSAYVALDQQCSAGTYTPTGGFNPSPIQPPASKPVPAAISPLLLAAGTAVVAYLLFKPKKKSNA